MNRNDGRMLRRGGGAALLVVLIVATQSTRRVSGAEVVTDLPFAVTGSSMWGTGPAFSFNASDFIGLQWSETVGIGPLPLDLLGFNTVSVSGTVSGRIGLEYDFGIDSGTVDVAYPAQATINHPERASAGEAVTVTSAATLTAASTLETRSPQARAKLALPFELAANINGSVDNFFVSVPFTLFPDLAVDATYTFFDINSSNPSFSYSLGDSSVTASIPTVNTSASSPPIPLTSTGSDTFLNLTLDVDEVASALIPQLPPLSGSLNLEVPFTDWEIIDLSYDLLDVDAFLNVNLKQDFQFAPELMVRYTFETGEVVVQSPDAPLNFVMPTVAQVGPSLEISAEYFLNNTFKNDTQIQLEPGMNLSVLSGSLSAAGVELVNFGPAYEASISTSIADISVFNSQFSLGFQIFQTEFSILIPEPSSIVYAGLALLSLGAVAARRQRTRRRAPVV